MTRRQAPPLFWRRLPQLLAGLTLFGAGMGCMVQASVGVSPWDVLATGLVNVTGLDFGVITVIVGVAVLLLWIPLREKPGIGTLLNVLMLGPVAQLVIWFVAIPESVLLRSLLFAMGLGFVALGSGLYIGAQFGPGPRDGIMTGLHRITGWPVWAVRTGIEVSVLLIGWMLGGNVGLGTLAFALLIGPLAAPAMRWFDLRQRILDEIARRENEQ